MMVTGETAVTKASAQALVGPCVRVSVSVDAHAAKVKPCFLSCCLLFSYFFYLCFLSFCSFLGRHGGAPSKADSVKEPLLHCPTFIISICKSFFDMPLHVLDLPD